MKRVFFLFLLMLPVVVCTNISAQGFLKKIAKGIESASKEVDKVLGTDTKSQSQSQQAKSTATGKQEAKVIKPFVTANTKTIYLEDIAFHFSYDDFSDGVAFVKNVKKDRWGTIDTLGNQLIDYVFDLSYNPNRPSPRYNSGVCILNSSILDKKGKVVKAIPNLSSYTNFDDNIAHVRLRFKDTKKSTTYREEYYYQYTYINTKGETVYPHLAVDIAQKNDGRDIPSLAPLHSLSEGLRAYWSYKSGWGFIDKSGAIIVKPAYRNVHDFSDGYAAVQNWEEKWGFIDKTGKLVIDCIYTNEPVDFSEGLAIVRKRDGAECYIDTAGNMVDLPSDEILKTVYGLGVFLNGKAFMEYAGGMIILDRDLKHYKQFSGLTGIYGKNIYAYANGLYYFRANNREMIDIVTEDGKRIYDGYSFKNGLAKFSDGPTQRDKKGYITETGEVKILFKEPEF
ncbi:MAG: WG repeat-containing protein [Prevotella sp.]|jgi:hypothetical protein|nr:WG repeat-containing protein [Prevotella sp.]